MSIGGMGVALLRRQLAEMSRNPPEGVSVGLVSDDNIYEWEVMICGPEGKLDTTLLRLTHETKDTVILGTMYEGGFFKARLKFPTEFPDLPPKMTFITDIWHPNVYSNGEVCISILHPPTDDPFNQQETAAERWRPVHGVESIIVSVISMLSDEPNIDSPANIDASVMWRTDRDAYKRKVRQCVRRSQEEF